jgi:integrase
MTISLKIHVPDQAPEANAPPPHFSDDPTVSQVLDWHQDNPSRKINSEVAEKERRRIWQLLRAALGDQPISRCKPFQALNFINAQAGLQSDWSRKRWNGSIQGPFNAALKLQWIARNPFRGLSFPRGKRGRDWTDQEYVRMLRASPPPFRAVLLVLRYSGMRPGEGREMQNTEVNLEKKKIVLEKHKMRYLTGKARPVPLHGRLSRLLERLRKRKPEGAKHLLLNSFGQPWTCQAVTKRLRRLRKSLGLPDDLKLHGLRHTFITRALMLGVDQPSLMEIVGHEQAATMKGYTHLADKVDHLSEAMAKAGGRASKGPKKGKTSSTPLFELADQAPVEPTPLFDLFE